MKIWTGGWASCILVFGGKLLGWKCSGDADCAYLTEERVCRNDICECAEGYVRGYLDSCKEGK